AVQLSSVSTRNNERLTWCGLSSAMDDGGRWLVVSRRRRVVAGERRGEAMASSVVLDAVGRRVPSRWNSEQAGRLEPLLSVVIGDGQR
ncbi:hypothetical protein Dimus_017656, partial [Dionaea muscipula]